MSSTPNDGGPAFPFRCQGESTAPEAYYGMTLRDWFAGQVACGDAVSSADSGWTSNLNVLTSYAQARAAVYYAVADAMLVERAKSYTPKP